MAEHEEFLKVWERDKDALATTLKKLEPFRDYLRIKSSPEQLKECQDALAELRQFNELIALLPPKDSGFFEIAVDEVNVTRLEDSLEVGFPEWGIEPYRGFFKWLAVTGQFDERHQKSERERIDSLTPEKIDQCLTAAYRALTEKSDPEAENVSILGALLDAHFHGDTADVLKPLAHRSAYYKEQVAIGTIVAYMEALHREGVPYEEASADAAGLLFSARDEKAERAKQFLSWRRQIRNQRSERGRKNQQMVSGYRAHTRIGREESTIGCSQDGFARS